MASDIPTRGPFATEDVSRFVTIAMDNRSDGLWVPCHYRFRGLVVVDLTPYRLRWSVTHEGSGLNICRWDTKQEAIAAAQVLLSTPVDWSKDRTAVHAAVIGSPPVHTVVMALVAGRLVLVPAGHIQKPEVPVARERPILFSGPMVRALLDGRKTQTRRVVKKWVMDGETDCAGTTTGGWVPGPCPYGQPGDRLWVRETWAPHADESRYYSSTTPASASIYYQADGGFWGDDDMRAGRGWCVAGDPHINQWRPSIHMPRWASRLTLEVTGVRVERLQDISEDDARAEGVAPNPVQDGTWMDYPEGGSAAGWKTAAGSFRALWRSINGAESWNSNPWVWVVEFRRVKDAQ